MTVSVVVPAHRAGPELEACLTALAGQAEVLVVDDGSPGEEVSRQAERQGFRALRLPASVGPAAARNRGVEHTSGEIVVFVDADVEVRPDTVALLAAALETEPAAFGSYDDQPRWRNTASLYANLRHHYVHQHSDPDTGTFWAGCGAVRRELFLAVGGFSEDYRRPSIEDIDLGMRLAARGDRPRLHPEIQVRHWKRWTVGSVVVTDVRDRALPWSQRILEAGAVPPVLNLDWSSRTSAMLAWAALLSGHPLPCLVLLALLNFGLVRLFLERRAPGCLALHYLYLLYSSAVFGAVALKRWALGVLLLAAALNFLAWGLVWPPLHPPDETQHFLYARDMAREPRWHMGLETTVPEEMVWLGDWAGLGDPAGRMPRHSRLRSVETWRALTRLAGVGQETYLKDDPYGRFVPNGPFRRYHPPLYPALCAPAHAALAREPIVLRLAAQRLVSVALALVTVWLVVLVGRELWPRAPGLSLALGAMVAFHPTFAFYAAVANNEMLEVALATLLALLVARPSSRSWWLGAVLTLGMMARLSFVAVAGCCLRRRSWLVFAMPLVLAGWWYVPLLTGETDEVVAYYKAGSYGADYRVPLSSPRAYLAQFDWDRWTWLGLDYWAGPLGTGIEHPESGAADWSVVAVAALAAFGAALTVTRLRRLPRIYLDLALPTVGLVLFYQALDYLMFRDGEGFFLIREQYLLPGIVGQMVFVLAGWLILTRWRFLPLAAAGAMVAANLHSLHRVLTHYGPELSWRGLVEQAAAAWWLPVPLALGLALALPLAGALLLAILTTSPGRLEPRREND